MVVASLQMMRQIEFSRTRTVFSAGRRWLRTRATGDITELDDRGIAHRFSTRLDRTDCIIAMCGCDFSGRTTA